MEITVGAISKFGVLDANTKQWFNMSKNVSLQQFVKDKSYVISYTEKPGKNGSNVRYVNSVLPAGSSVPAAASSTAAVVAVQTTSAPTVSAPKKAMVYGREASEYELAKDKRIGIAGIVQAVIQSPAYAHIASTMMDESEIDSFLAKKAEYWLAKVKELSQA